MEYYSFWNKRDITIIKWKINFSFNDFHFIVCEFPGILISNTAKKNLNIEINIEKGIGFQDQTEHDLISFEGKNTKRGHFMVKDTFCPLINMPFRCS